MKLNAVNINEIISSNAVSVWLKISIPMPISSYTQIQSSRNTERLPLTRFCHRATNTTQTILLFPYLILCFLSRTDFPKGTFTYIMYDAVFICTEKHLQFHLDMICCQLEVHTGMKNGILIYSVVVQNLVCVSSLTTSKLWFVNWSNMASFILLV